MFSLGNEKDIAFSHIGCGVDGRLIDKGADGEGAGKLVGYVRDVGDRHVVRNIACF